jgi:tartrate dehydrogenase/decarboxylase/D-malate dehydrogenase
VTEKKVWRIAVIPGDGIGTEVVREGQRVLDALAEDSGARFTFEWESFPWGSEYYLEHGRMMAEDALETLEGFDAIYFGAVGWPGVPDHVSLWGLRIAICQGFDQYANVRPVKLLPGVESPLRGASAETMDWVVVRENSEGEYSGLGGRNLSGRGPGKEVAIQSSLFTEEGCERIMRFAFEMALTRRRKKVTSVTKSNAQQYSSVLWDEVFARVSAEYPDVETEQWLVDAMAARFVLRPETLEVVVASNLFADILSDLGGALAGSLGVAASANLDPIGALASAALMLEHLGLGEEAERVNRAIEATSGAGLLTPDLGGTSTTREVGDAVLRHLSRRPDSA